MQEERLVGNDNTVRYRGLSLQIPPSPLRPHFVKARVRVHDYPDGTRAIFPGPRRRARYRADGAALDHDALLAACRRGAAALGICGRRSALPTSPTGPTTTALNPCATNTGQLNLLSTPTPWGARAPGRRRPVPGKRPALDPETSVLPTIATAASASLR